MEFRNAEMYYWSGTGNTRIIAKHVQDFLERSNINTKINNVLTVNPKKVNVKDNNSALFVFTPVHGFTAPYPVLKFCVKLPRSKRADAFVVSTRGCLNPGFFLRGLSASTTFIIALILLLKGYSVKGLFSVDLPSNWTVLFPGLSEKTSKRFIDKAKKRIDKFVNKIKHGKNHIASWDNLFEFVMGMALLPISFVYMLIGRFFLAKLFFANEECTSCGICYRNCPHGAIMMKNDKKNPYWTFKCESCGRCVNYCPEEAIEAGQSIGILFIYLSGLITALFHKEIFFKLGLPDFMHSGTFLFFIDIPIKLLIFFIVYLIIHYISRIRIFNRIFTCTTLTKLYRRYHEPETKLKDFRE